MMSAKMGSTGTECEKGVRPPMTYCYSGDFMDPGMGMAS